MAPTTVNVTGKVFDPSGAVQSGGRIEVTLQVDGSVEDGGTSHRVGGKFTVVIGSDGTVDFDIIPNDAITPDTTTYNVKYYRPDGTFWTDSWTVAASPSSQEIGDL